MEIPAAVATKSREFIHQRTVAFWGHHDVHSKGEPKQYGSGVLLQVDDTRWVVSAEHVTALFLKHGCSAFIGAGSSERGVIPLVGKVWRSARADVAAIALKEETWSQFSPDKRFTRLSEVAPEDPAGEIGGLYCAFGYPSATSDVDHDARMFNMTAKACFGFPLAKGTQSFDASKHIAVEFDERSTPDPSGMSGGGIRRIHQAGVPTGRWSENDIRLVAVEHTWGVDGRALYGTRIESVLALIRKHDPSLIPAMELAWPGKTRFAPERWVVDD